ncbi:MAG: general L-amino acid transport system permease protein [Candidatus Aldehydirespiratoraceae bacterium]|jgi:general L-amino acid transport system permease protein
MESAIIDPEVNRAITETNAPRHSDQSPSQWLKSNLFNSWYNTIVTVVFGALGLLFAFFALRFLIFTARWEPVRDNLQLFFVGRFPREETTRLVVQLLALSGAGGLFAGWLRQRARIEAELAGVEPKRTSPRELVGSYWASVLFLVVSMIIGVTTFRPWLIVVGCVISAATCFVITMKPRRGAFGIALALAPLVPFLLAAGVLTFIPDLSNSSAYMIAAGATVVLALTQYLRNPAVTLSAAALLGVSGFQVLSGTSQLSWVFLTLALIPGAFALTSSSGKESSPLPGILGSIVFGGGVVFYVVFNGFTTVRWITLLAGLAVAVWALVSATNGDGSNGRRLGMIIVLGFATWQIGRLIGLEGIDWVDWGGLHLNLVVAAASTALAFPMGLLLALGRRSSLPVLRWLCTAYIEMIRGVPLISLLLMAQLFIGFFLSSGGNSNTLTTKSLVVITMFSSAYIAEIVRGGLQAVPTGQTEAGQAMGMSPAKITRLLVLPQALKAVIPAMVGQFISLFKDTSLLTIIGVLEFLGVREIIHAQPDFRGFGLVETLVFVAFGFWAISFTMSRESQRLERSLDVGAR